MVEIVQTIPSDARFDSSTQEYKKTSYSQVNICTIDAIDCPKKATKGTVKTNSTSAKALLTSSNVTKNVNAYKEIKERRRTDKRVFLNVRPLVTNPSLFVDRVEYVLGNKQKRIAGGNVYGFLYSCLSPTVGLVFPYTPQIDISHKVNYEKTDILHSNLSIHHYKNTPPPSYSISATFTSDTKEMAKHMLSAIWFLRAVTKCDFGERANIAGSNNSPGMPPPILYLNGWNNMLDNIPVIVTGFSYSLPKDKNYVGLSLNLDSLNQEYLNTMFSNYETGDYYSTNGTKAYNAASDNSAITFVNGQPISLSNAGSENTSTQSGRNDKNRFFLQEWLPTELTINIQLEVQPNLLKYKKNFDLNEYKMGILYLDVAKGGSDVYTINSNGDCERIFSFEEIYTPQYDYENKSRQYTPINGTYEVSPLTQLRQEALQQSLVPIVYTKEVVKTEIGSANNTVGGFDITPTKYQFDNSGWTW